MKKTIKITITCIVSLLVLSSIVAWATMKKNGFFEYRKQGQNYFYNNDKYIVQTFVDDRRFEVATKLSGFDYWLDRDFNGMHYSVRVRSTREWDTIRRFEIAFYNKVKFRGGPVATRRPAMIDWSNPPSVRLSVGAKSEDGEILKMSDRGEGSGRDKNSEWFEFSPSAQNINEFENFDFELSISNVIINYYARK